jgi:hypothetical protein
MRKKSKNIPASTCAYYMECAKNLLKSELQESAFYGLFYEKLSIIVIGSWSSGSFDKYSDIDFVVGVPDQLYDLMYENALNLGVVKSTGDLRIETYEPLEIAVKIRSLSQINKEIERDLNIALRIYNTGEIWQDPKNQLQNIVKYHEKQFCEKISWNLREKVTRMRNAVSFYEGMMLRENYFSCEMLKFQFIQNFLEGCFLAERKPYPYIKWLQYWAIRETKIGHRFCNNLLELQEKDKTENILNLMRKLLIKFESTCLQIGVEDSYIVRAMDDPWFQEKFKWRLEVNVS